MIIRFWVLLPAFGALSCLTIQAFAFVWFSSRSTTATDDDGISTIEHEYTRKLVQQTNTDDKEQLLFDEL